MAADTAARRHGLEPIARILCAATAGVAPRVMGIGPASATEKLCERLGLAPTAFDMIELNDAFASQGLATLRRLGNAADGERVNPNSGAIALGHPALWLMGRTFARAGGAGRRRAPGPSCCPATRR